MNPNATRSLKYFFLALLLMAGRSSAVHAETEPNNTLTTANAMAFSTSMPGGVCAPDNDDWFRVVQPAGGKSIRLITTASMTVAAQTGAVYVYLYNKYGTQLTNKYVALTSASLTDTLDYTCFEGDTFYVRIYNWSGSGCKQYSIRCENTGNFSLRNDAEVNDVLATAVALPFQKDTTGHLGSQRYLSAAYTDNDDWFRCVMPAVGTKSLRLISASRSVEPGTTGAVYYYLYNKFGTQLTNKYVSFGNTLKPDTLDYTCFEGDTFYVRVYNWSGSCKEYRIKTDFTPNYTLQNDAEPNDNLATAIDLPFQKDTTGHLGSQRYISGVASTDNDDYFRCVLPAAGKKSLRLISAARSVEPGTTAAVYYYLYNKYGQQLTGKYVSFGNTLKLDTLDYTCFEGDTFYVRVYNWSGSCKEYRIKTDFTPNYAFGNDAEPNDALANATDIPFQRDTTGHLGSQRYLTGASTDNDDYYRCVLPPAGIKSLRLISAARSVEPGTTAAVYYYLYNKYGQQLTGKYVSFSNTLKLDTLDYTCFEGDTFYVRVYNWSGSCKEYRIKTDFTPDFTLPADTGSNATIATATPVPYKGIVTGHLGAQAYEGGAAPTDNDDYFRCILPDNGKGVRIVAKARMAEKGATGAVYYYIYSKTGSVLASKYFALTDAMKSDTLEYNCLQPDTFYIRFYNWSGPCKEYRFQTTQSTTGPIAFDIEHTRFGNDFSFMNTTRNATKFAWNFGDGMTDTVAAPVHTYGIGKFITTLNATNVCGTRVFRDTIEVSGVEYYTPKRAGTDIGMGTFVVRVFGGGLDSALTLTLKKDGKEHTPTDRRSPGSKEFTGNFNFKDLPPGMYDVSIRLSNGQAYNYPAGFEVFVDTPSRPLRVQIVGPDRVRTGRVNSYAVKVINDKHRAAIGAVVCIAVSKGVETNIKEILWKRTSKYEIKGDGYNKLTIDRDLYNKVYYDGAFDPATEVITVDYAELNKYFDTLASFPIKTLYGEPFEGTVYPLYIPYIAANSTHTISFTAKTPGNGDHTVLAYAWPHVQRNNPGSLEGWETVHDIGANLGAAAEMAPHPWLKGLGKAVGWWDIGTQIVATEYYDYKYGINNANDGFYGKQSLAAAGELGGNLLPFGKKADDYGEAAGRARRAIQSRTENIHMDELLLKHATDPGMRKSLTDQLARLRERLDLNTHNLSLFEREEFINNFTSTLLKKGISLTSKEISDLLFPEDIPKKNVASSNSYDPNAIYGPDGYNRGNFIRKASTMNYLITFENVDTAKAPAQVVRVFTDLDTAKFDMRETWLSSVGFGGKTYYFEDDRKEYFRDIDLRPAKNMIVRVNAKTDTVSGRLYWEFLSLDPLTKSLIDDVDDGFLPPNKTSPEGEGSVSFTTKLKPGLRNGDSVSAFAAIYFDENEPILTNTWKNTIDERAPASTLAPAVTVAGDTLMTLSLEGTDGESGFKECRVYIKQGDSAWSERPIQMNFASAAAFTGTPGETYSFYVEGRDSVGIWERKQQAAEATVTLQRTSGPVPQNGMQLYPNPARTSVTVTVNAAAGPLQIVITDVTGRRAMESAVDHAAGSRNYELPLAGFGSGIYFVEAIINGSALPAQKLVIVR